MNKELLKFYFELQSCSKCSIGSLPVNTRKPNSSFGKVIGFGNQESEILFVAQNPADKRHGFGCFEINDKGANKIFHDTLSRVKINRQDVFCTNLVKCSTADNKKPSDFVKNCSEVFVGELEFLKPKIIVAVGSLSMEYFNVNVRTFSKWRDYTVFGMYHPSYIQRTQEFESYKDDFETLRSFIEEEKKNGRK